MKNLFAIPLFFMVAFNSIGQSRTGSIEIKPFYQLDAYPSLEKYTNSRVEGLTSNSLGIGVEYKRQLFRQTRVGLGLGYQVFRFNSPGNENSRTTKNFLPEEILIYTNNYDYQTASVNLSLIRDIYSAHNFYFGAGIYSNNHFSFNKKYDFKYKSISYQEAKFQYFGSTVGITTTFQKSFGNISLGPTLNIPIVSVWKNDDFFKNKFYNDYQVNWVSGLNIGLSVVYKL